MITEQEKNRSRKNIFYANGSCELEGCIITSEHKRCQERYINGEISMQEMGNIIMTEGQKWIKDI